MNYDSVISLTPGRYSAIIVQRGPLSRLPVCSPEHQVPSEKGLILYKSVRFFVHTKPFLNMGLFISTWCSFRVDCLQSIHSKHTPKSR